MTQWIEADNWGQAPGLLGPPNIDYIYRDPDKDLDIHLMEYEGPKVISLRVANRDRHWMVGCTVNVGRQIVSATRPQHRDISRARRLHVLGTGRLSKKRCVQESLPRYANPGITETTRSALLVGQGVRAERRVELPKLDKGLVGVGCARRTVFTRAG